MAELKRLFGSGISTAPDWRKALEEAAEAALQPLGGEAPDLAILFTTPHHAHAEEALGRRARARLRVQALAGTTAHAVIGGGREVEGGPALALFAARLEGVDVRPFAVPAQEDAEAPLEEWRAALPFEPGEKGLAILFADPFTLDPGGFLEALDERFPDLPVAGGIASGGARPGQNRLYVGDETLVGGGAGIFLAGDVAARTVVSQGCRPIGKHLVITKADRHFIHQVGGRPALEALREIVNSLGEKDRRLVQRALHVGCVIDERRDSFGRGDFLIRNPIGANPETGSLAVGGTFRAGQTIQFHVRDAEAADEDLRHLLDEVGGPARAALLFTCNGRGQRFFGTPDHDTRVIEEKLGRPPVAGFFCGGEFGPIGRRNFVHGYTSTVVIF